MQQRIEAHSFNGLQRDLDISKHPVNYLYDAFNIRITAREEDTLLSITNERGPKQLFTGENKVKGKYLGSCMLNQYLIIFSTNREQGFVSNDFIQHDYITRIDFSKSEPELKVLFDGNLNFHPDYLIEAIVSYENEDIQKAYWTDGYNQPRFINFAPNNDDKLYTYNSGSFNFVQDLQLEEEIEVERIESASGLFTPGTIQYAFSYFNKNGAESNIFYTTPLYYTSLNIRGGKQDETVSNVFKITFNNIEENFEYIRVYSIHRSSINSTTTIKHVDNIKITGDETYIYYDTGTNGESLDPTQLLYIGGEEILADTLEQKDGTLFFGNIKIKREQIDSELKTAIAALIPESEIKEINLSGTKIDSNYYQYSSSLQYENSAGFKKGETYRLGLQFQYKNGRWSEPCYIGEENDWTQTESPSINQDKLQIPIFKIDINSIKDQIGSDYKKVRTLVVFPKETERNIIAQGIICPTVFNPEDRKDNAPYAQSSWFLRPSLSHTIWSTSQKCDEKDVKIGEEYTIKYANAYVNGIYAEFRDSLYIPYTSGVEKGLRIPLNAEMSKRHFAIDQNILNLYSPELIFNESLQNLPINNQVEIDLIGLVNFDANIGKVDIETSSASMHNGGGPIEKKFGLGLNVEYDQYKGGRSLIGGPLYKDTKIFYEDEQYKGINGTVDYMIYPWHSNGSLNNDVERESDKGTRTAVLKKKRIGNLKFSSNNIYFDKEYKINSDEESGNEYKISDIKIFNSDQITMQRLFLHDNVYANYYGNVDTAVEDQIVNIFQVNSNWENVSNNEDGYRHDLVSTITSIGLGADSVNVFSTRQEIARIKYKTTPHFVFALGSTNLQRQILPSISNPVKEYINAHPNYINAVSQNFKIIKEVFHFAEYWRVGNSDYEKENRIKYQWDGWNDLVASEIIVRGIRWGNQYKPQIQHEEDYLNYAWGETFIDAIRVFNDRFSKTGCELNPSCIFQQEYIYVDNSSKGHATIYRKKEGSSKFAQGQSGIISFEELVAKDLDQVGTIVKLVFQKEKDKDTIVTNNKLIIKHENGNWEEYKEIKEDDGITSSDSIYQEEIHINRLEENCKAFLFLGEIRRKSVENRFGGFSETARQNNLWIPAGKATKLESDEVLAEYGDTWYQRFDCLKTYSFTSEDPNQVIEIGSFMCESHINLDGRCDINRGNEDVLNMSPLNFNLMNDAYSQQDNFFNYRILDESFYKDRKFSNQITWTKEKHPGEDIDAWTNITLASTYDLDGSKGPIQSLNAWKDQIYCFQDKGISNILFNSRVQIQTSDGVPIEISNNYKVDGYRYITDGIGNINKNAIKVTPSGIYFIDSISNNLYHIGESISDISTTHNMTTWFKGNNIQNLLYDNVNHDIYVVNKDEALCYSEILGQFTSRMSYGGLNVLENYRNNVYGMKYRPSDGIRLYHMFKGEYDTYLEWCSNDSCIIDRQPWSITFVSNGIPYNQTDYDKVFENIDYRMDSYSLDDDQWILDNEDSLSSILVENEYQSTGVVDLENTKDRPSNLKSKFRTWRINIPRNAKLDSRGRGIRDRIRNQWCKITLSKAVSHKKCILHDINVTYYI